MAKLGNKNGRGNRGKIRTREMVEAMRIRSLGNKNMLGKHHSDITKEKISKSRKGKCMGNDHPAWKGGVTPIHNKIRGSNKYKIWERKCKKRDLNCCQKCKEHRIKYLMVHHIVNFAQYKKLRFDINNGITLCRLCHKDFHRIYGKKDNTKEQLLEFLKS